MSVICTKYTIIYIIDTIGLTSLSITKLVCDDTLEMDNEFDGVCEVNPHWAFVPSGLAPLILKGGLCPDVYYNSNLTSLIDYTMLYICRMQIRIQDCLIYELISSIFFKDHKKVKTTADAMDCLIEKKRLLLLLY